MAKLFRKKVFHCWNIQDMDRGGNITKLRSKLEMGVIRALAREFRGP